MWPRFPTRLWRLISEDLWRLAALTLASLAGIVSFAAGVRPLAEGQIGPADALRFMALALVPMLQFTAPFAAGFAATLVYHRFTTENESLAASAGGISNRAILGPAFGMGLTLAIVVALLANFVIPTFLRSMQALVSKDVARVIINSIENGDSVELNGLAIHADRAIRGKPDPAHGVMDRLFLTGVIAFDSDADGAIQAEVVAERAEVLLSTERRDGQTVTVVRMRLEGAVGKQQNQGFGQVGTIPIGPWIVPNAFEETPRFFSFIELGDLKRHPERHHEVDQLRIRLAGALTKRRAERLLVAAISGESRVVFIDSLGQRLAVRAKDIQRDGDRWRLIPLGDQGVEVDLTTSDGARRSQIAQDAWVFLSADAVAGPASISLELKNVGALGANTPVRQRLVIDQLHLETDPGADLYALSAFDLERKANQLIEQARDDPEIVEISDRLDALEARIGRLNREILGNHNERFALAAACLLMTLAGAIIALRLRDRMPLSVYLWSFFPALGAVITISGGENATSQNQTVGLSVLWGGIGLLALYTWVQYLKLNRH